MITDGDRNHLERCVQLAADALNAGNEPFGSILISAGGTKLSQAIDGVAGGDAT